MSLTAGGACISAVTEGFSSLGLIDCSAKNGTATQPQTQMVTIVGRVQRVDMNTSDSARVGYEKPIRVLLLCSAHSLTPKEESRIATFGPAQISGDAFTTRHNCAFPEAIKVITTMEVFSDLHASPIDSGRVTESQTSPLLKAECREGSLASSRCQG